MPYYKDSTETQQEDSFGVCLMNEGALFGRLIWFLPVGDPGGGCGWVKGGAFFLCVKIGWGAQGVAGEGSSICLYYQ